MVYRLLISFFVGILFLNTASAQWVNVAPNLLGNIPSTCCAFGSFAHKDGITWVGRTGMWMSIDSGKTWTTISISFNGAITQIEFFDKNTGVFGTDAGDVVLTTDQGKSWNVIHKGGQCYGVSFCGSANNIIVVSDYAGVFYTSDQGKNWNSAPTGGHVLCCIGKKDGSALIHNEGEIRKTTDFGKSWQSISSIDYDSWSFALDSSSADNLYLMNEEGHIPTDNKASIFHSVDGGSTWVDLEKHSGRFFSGSLALTRGAIYAQTLNNGIFRSTDQGQIWVSICGPSNNIDSRLICAIDDDNIIAADAQGSIWRITPSKPAPVSFSISTALRINQDTLGAEIFLPIYLNAKGTMPSFDMVVHYPSTLLKYMRSVTINSKIVDIPGEQWAGRAKIHFDAADLLSRKDSLIGYSVFKQLPEDTDCAHVTLDSARAIVGQPCAGLTTITAYAAAGIIGAPKRPDVSFSISSKRIIKDSLGVTVYLPIFLKSSRAMPSLDMIVHYPTLPLEFIKAIIPSGKRVDVQGAEWPGRAKLHFEAADLAARKDSLIGYCVFKWSPYEYDCAHILFDSMQANIPATPCSGKATVSGTASDGLIGSYPSCGLDLETDVDPPQFQVNENKANRTDTLIVNDGRSTDEGLKSITWVAEQRTDTTKVIVLPVTPPVIPCYDDKINHIIRVVQLDSTAGGCYDFTFTDCLWHKSYDTICFAAHIKSGVQGNSSLPLMLDANHPNPFSHITTFSYSTGEYGMVRLYLYDELGREAARIIDIMQTQGSHSVDFDGSKLPSGSYTIRLESMGKILSRRVVIER